MLWGKIDMDQIVNINLRIKESNSNNESNVLCIREVGPIST